MPSGQAVDSTGYTTAAARHWVTQYAPHDTALLHSVYAYTAVTSSHMRFATNLSVAAWGKPTTSDSMYIHCAMQACIADSTKQTETEMDSHSAGCQSRCYTTYPDF